MRQRELSLQKERERESSRAVTSVILPSPIPIGVPPKSHVLSLTLFHPWWGSHVSALSGLNDPHQNALEVPPMFSALKVCPSWASDVLRAAVSCVGQSDGEQRASMKARPRGVK